MLRLLFVLGFVYGLATGDWWVAAGLGFVVFAEEYPPLWYYASGAWALLALARFLDRGYFDFVIFAASAVLYVRIARVAVSRWSRLAYGRYRYDSTRVAVLRLAGRLYGRRTYVALDRYGNYICNLTTKRTGPPLPDLDTLHPIEELSWHRYDLRPKGPTR